MNHIWTSRNHPEIVGSSGSSLPITSKSFNTKRATINLPKNAKKSTDRVSSGRQKTPGARPSPQKITMFPGTRFQKLIKADAKPLRRKSKDISPTYRSSRERNKAQRPNLKVGEKSSHKARQSKSRNQKFMISLPQFLNSSYSNSPRDRIMTFDASNKENLGTIENIPSSAQLCKSSRQEKRP